MPPLAALLAWPVISAVFFQRARVGLAVILTVLGGFLFLPEQTEIDISVLPSLDKYTLPALVALIFAAVFVRPSGRFDQTQAAGAQPGILFADPLPKMLFFGLMAGVFVTVLLNSDRLVYGPRVLAGLSAYDGVSLLMAKMLLILPAFLARKYLATPEGQRLLLIALCGLALGYSLLALIEVRLSPQLNRWVYGFFPHHWGQHVRAGGFRPVVFLPHGLVLAIFMSMAMLAAFGLSRVDGKRRVLWLCAGGWLLATLVLSNSLGALVIGVLLLPVMLFVSTRVQLLLAALIAVAFLTYPMLRGSGLVPTSAIVSVAERIDAQRASSLQFRFDNEEELLDKTAQRPLFGWGSWGRWRVYDPQTGVDQTVSDGYWVIIISSGGWLRYIFETGLITLPIFLLYWRARRYRVGRESAVLALVLAANLVDMIPNGSLTPLTWLLAGALWGRLEVRAPNEAPDEDPGEAGQGAPADMPANMAGGGGGAARPAMGHTRAAGAVPVKAGQGPDAPTAPTRPDTSGCDSIYTRQKERFHRRRPTPG